MKFEQVIQHLMNGKPVTRTSWDDDLHIRYADLFETFVMHTGSESHTLDALRLDAECLVADDWIYGVHHPVKDEITWILTTS